MRAYNAQDADALRDLYADDITYDMVGLFSVSGRDMLEGLIEYDFANRAQLLLTQMRVEGDAATCVIRERNDWLAAAGIEEARHTATFEFSGGRISAVRAQPDPESTERILGVLQSLATWASKERPAEWAALMPQGRFIYDADSARRIRALLRDWREATGGV